MGKYQGKCVVEFAVIVRSAETRMVTIISLSLLSRGR